MRYCCSYRYNEIIVEVIADNEEEALGLLRIRGQEARDVDEYMPYLYVNFPDTHPDMWQIEIMEEQ